jgi:hypothetical protein
MNDRQRKVKDREPVCALVLSIRDGRRSSLTFSAIWLTMTSDGEVPHVTPRIPGNSRTPVSPIPPLPITAAERARP